MKTPDRTMRPGSKKKKIKTQLKNKIKQQKRH